MLQMFLDCFTVLEEWRTDTFSWLLLLLTVLSVAVWIIPKDRFDSTSNTIIIIPLSSYIELIKALCKEGLCPRFKVGKSKAQRGDVTCPRSLARPVIGREPSSPESQSSALCAKCSQGHVNLPLGVKFTTMQRACTSSKHSLPHTDSNTLPRVV